MINYKLEWTEFDPDIPEAGGMMCAYNLQGDYIGDEDTAKYLDKRGISPELISEDRSVCSIGFNEKEQKWYGWSHRAIFGFGVGSVMEKGMCGFTPDNPEEMIEEHANWLDGDDYEKRKAACWILEDRSGIRIIHSPLVIPMATSVDDLNDFIDDPETPASDTYDIFGGENAIEVRLCGKGKWEAKTLEDAKQMAIDFANGVA